MSNERVHESLNGDTVHRRIAERVRREVRALSPGSRVASQNELARRFGVGHTTVREALNALVQEGCIERRDGSGTYVVDPKRYKHIGILSELDIAQPGSSFFFQSLVQGLRRFFLERHYSVRVYIGHTKNGAPAPDKPSCEAFWEELQRDRILGLAVVGTPSAAKWQQDLRKRGIPVVDDKEVSSLAHRPSARQNLRDQALRALAARGVRRLALADWSHDGRPGRHLDDSAGAAAAAGFEVRPEWVMGVRRRHYVDEGGAALESLWRRAVKPQALIVFDDMLFYSMMPAFLRLGVGVPRDLQLVVETNRSDPRPPCFGIDRLEIDETVMRDVYGHRLLNLLTGEAMPDFSRRSIGAWIPRPEAESFTLKLEEGFA